MLGFEHHQEIYNTELQIGSSNSSTNYAGSGRPPHQQHRGGQGQGNQGGGRNNGNWHRGNQGEGGGNQGRGGGQGQAGGGHNGGNDNWRCGNQGGGGGGGPRPTCQLCGKQGHVALKCFRRFDSSFHGEDDQPSVNIIGYQSGANIVYQVDPNWYSDTGATDHITSDLDRLSFHECYNGTDNVQVGNEAGLHIAHIGQSSITISANNTFALRNVLHVPHITKMISIYRLTKYNDVFVEFHATFLSSRT
jgi:histone deacetylase 1/2